MLNTVATMAKSGHLLIDSYVGPGSPYLVASKPLLQQHYAGGLHLNAQARIGPLKSRRSITMRTSYRSRKQHLSQQHAHSTIPESGSIVPSTECVFRAFMRLSKQLLHIVTPVGR